MEKKLLRKVSHSKVPFFSKLRHIGKVLRPIEKRIIQLCLFVILASAAFLVYANYFRQEVLGPKFGGIYTEGLIGSPLYINPLLSQTNDVDQDLTRLIFNGLVRFDQNYQIVPDLAESWKVSDDQKEYTFKLRRGMTWHDGEPVTVHDVVFTFQTIQDKNVRSPLARTFAGVTCETISEDEVKFTLTEPFSGFLSTLTAGIIPQHLWTDISADNFQLAKYNQKPVGTGPYIFKSFLKDKNGQIISYTLTANDDYHLSKPFIETLNLNFYPEYAQALDSLKNQQIDGIGFLPKEYLDQVSKRTTTIYTADLSQFTAIFLNADKNDLLKNTEVKKALLLATNKKQILTDVMQDQGQIISSPILPTFPGYDQNIVDEYDLNKAQEVLKADKWEMNKDGVLAKKDVTLTFTITTIDQPDLVKLVKIIQDQWQQIGLKIELNIVPKASF
ncbi:MAG: peptide ABC transporter substrate-binding protein, partial [Janthinobacterium sp.]